MYSSPSYASLKIPYQPDSLKKSILQDDATEQGKGEGVALAATGSQLKSESLRVIVKIDCKSLVTVEQGHH